MSISFREAFPQLEQSKVPDPKLVETVFDSILEGNWSPTQTAAFAVALRLKGETAEVISAAAHTLRRHMIPLTHEYPRLLDTCGTGGDGLGSLNLSTGAALIAAAAGAQVAKHGNRAVSSKSGSADVLESLGIRLELSPAQEARVLAQTGIVFLYAPSHHPTFKHIGQARRELGIRTVFNCLGPLANPARASHQLLGAYDDALRPVLAQALSQLGVERAWVVRGENGMDEMNPFGLTRVTALEQGVTRELSFRPEDFALVPCVAGATQGGDAEENAQILVDVLEGVHHPSRNAFLLNAAAALCVYDGDSPRDATARATQALTSGAARKLLDNWRQASQAAAQEA